MKRAGFFVGLLLFGCSDEGLCDREEIVSALESASTGDIVRLGRCRIAGRLTVPQGVHLIGEGQNTVIEAPAGDAAIIVMPGGSSVEDLAIEVQGSVGLQARGAQDVRIKGVQILATLGIGMALEDADVTIEDTQLVGPVTPSIVSQIANPPAPAQIATHGLVAHRANLILQNVDVSAFAAFGALFVRSQVQWAVGTVSENVSVGIGAESGTLSLSDLEVRNTREGTGLIPPYGVVTASTTVETERLAVLDGDAYGLFHQSGAVTHRDLVGSGNVDAALWVQNTNALELTGELADNGFAGVAAVDATNFNVHNTTIRDTRGQTRLFHEGGRIRVGDGIHLVRSIAGAQLTDVNLTNNERAGLLVELGGGRITPAVLERVQVTVSSTSAGGVVAQNGTLDPGWDSGVTRIGTDAASDAQRAGLPSVEVVGPCNLPRPSQVDQGGVSILTGI